MRLWVGCFYWHVTFNGNLYNVIIKPRLSGALIPFLRIVCCISLIGYKKYTWTSKFFFQDFQTKEKRDENKTYCNYSTNMKRKLMVCGNLIDINLCTLIWLYTCVPSSVLQTSTVSDQAIFYINANVSKFENVLKIRVQRHYLNKLDSLWAPGAIYQF